MPLLCDFPSPPVAREAFAGGFTSKGVALLTLDELEMYSRGRGARRERRYKCPFCGASEQAFHVNAESGAFNCKRNSCGVKGILREFWREREPMKANERARRDTARAFAPLASKPSAEGEGERGNWRALWEGALALDGPGARKGCDFLAARGSSVDLALASGARFCANWAPSPEGKIYSGGAAVLYPLLSGAREVVAVGGRYVGPVEPKARVGGALDRGVFLAPVWNGQKWLCPLDFEAPCIVEGPADALALASCGAPAIAAHGCNLPQWLAGALAFKTPFLSPDADNAGEKALLDWKREIGPFAPRFRVLRPANAKDFGEMLQNRGRAELRAWLRAAGVPLLDRNTEEEALARLDPQLLAAFPRPVAVEIGLNLLALDRGEEIE